MFVHPAQVARVVKSFPHMGRARLEVSEIEGKDQMTFVCELPSNDEAQTNEIAEAIRAECRLRAEIKIVPPNSLPNDGKVIEDRRAIGV